MNRAGGDQDLANVRRVYSFWGRHARLYAAQDFVSFMGRPGPIRGVAAAKLGLREGDAVLEVACGSGRNLRYLEAAVGAQGRVVGFDYSAEMLAAADDLCRRHGWDNVRLVQGDAAALDVGEERFDGVLSVLGMSAVPGYESAVKRCWEVLREGGVLSVCDARLFPGRLAVLNPLVRAIFSRGAAWDPSRDIPATMRSVFGNLEVEELNLGSLYVATAVKRRES